MDINELKNLSIPDALKKAGEFAGVDASVLEGIWATESGKGKNMLSPAGAQGHFGLMPKTRALFEKKLGVKVDPNNFYDSLFVAANHLKEDMEREKGDLPSALRAYNNGPNWRNQRDPRGENAAYASKVLGADLEPVAKQQELDPTRMPPMPVTHERPVYMPKTTEALASVSFLQSIMADTAQGDDAFNKAVKFTSEHDAATQKEIDNTSFLDLSKASFMHQGVAGAALTSFARGVYPRTPGFVVPEAALVGKTEDEQHLLLSAGSQAELDRFSWEVDREREDKRTMGLRGPWWAAAASIFAGAPEGFVTGFVAAKALSSVGMGSAAAAAAGQTGRAMGYSAIENIGGNVLAAAAEDAITGRVSIWDYGMAAAIGGVFTPVGIHSTARKAAQALEIRATEEAAKQAEKLAKEAIAELGPNANADQIKAWMDNREASQVKARISANTGEMPALGKMLPDIDKLIEKELARPEPKLQVAEDRVVSADTSNVNSAIVNEPGKELPIIKIKAQTSAGESTMSRSTSDHDWLSDGMLDGMVSHLELHYPGLFKNKESLVEFRNLPHGVHLHDSAKELLPGPIKAVEWAMKTFLPDVRVIVHTKGDRVGMNGSVISLNDNSAIMFLNPSATRNLMGTALHEVGHLVLNRGLNEMAKRGAKYADLVAGMKGLHADFLKHYSGEANVPDLPGIPRALSEAIKLGGLSGRAVDAVLSTAGTEPIIGGYRPTLMDVMSGVIKSVEDNVKRTAGNVHQGTSYIPNFDEFGAEQFRKYIEAAWAGETKWKPASIPTAVVNFFAGVYDRLASLFNGAKKAGFIGMDERASAFFEGVRTMGKARMRNAERAAAGLDPYHNPAPDLPVLPDAMPDVATTYGLDTMPEATALQRAEKQALTALYTRASNPEAKWNNLDPNRLKSLIANNDTFAPTATLMFQSKNPVVRMVAADLLESTTGAAGRDVTAALSKKLFETQMVGNVVNEYTKAYTAWRNAQGGNILGDFHGGELKQKFDKHVAEEIEWRRANQGESEAAPAVKTAADSIEQAYERMRVAQVNGKTTGWGGLPETSRGYMPHRLSAANVRNMTNEQMRAFHSALVDQFITVEGWDVSFSANLASKYLDRARQRALGSYDVAGSTHQVGAADMVEDALEAMGMSRDEVRAQMQRYMRGAAGHTKARLQLDLLQDHDGLRLIDLYETDQLSLVRNQARRVSGEVALARHGIMGRPGLKLLRRAMEFGTNDGKAQPREVGAFDQVSAEFLGTPFGEAGGKWMDGAMMMTSLARLGGMGITQAGETINVGAILGVNHAMKMVGSVPRLFGEIRKLAKGEAVENPIIGSLERVGGEIGTEHYKMVFPFDNPALQHQVNETHTLGMASRLLRAGTHAQGILSGWRAVHSVQVRGVAEQIVIKASRMIRDGGFDKNLADMGITKELAARLKDDLSNIATWEGDTLKEFDITKAADKAAQEQFVQAVHRGSAQIIQGTFIGETGAWAHSGWLRMMTQFRSFGITSIEKQWNRNVANHGVGVAIMTLVGALSVAMPLHAARVWALSAGRPDREEYLKKELSFEKLARASLNYVSMSGLTSDLLDGLSAVSGVGTPSGGRSGGATDFFGSVVAPSAGLVDDLWRGVQNTKDGTDPHALVKHLPFANLPMLRVGINALAED